MWRVRSLIIQAKCGTFATGMSLLHEKGEAMRKTLMALAAVATLAVSAVAAPAPAHAQRGFGPGLAAGLIGGAIVGGALAGPGYYGTCTWQRQRFWDGYGWRIRRVRVCG